MQFDIVVAVDSENGIGKNNSIPWRLPADLRYFKKLTTSAAPGKQNAVIMGRKTWESLPPKSCPLKDRLNIVLSSKTISLPEGVVQARSLRDALHLACTKDVDRCFVIGGGKVYEEALRLDELNSVYLTQVYGNFDCDVFFPVDTRLTVIDESSRNEENGISFAYRTLRRVGTAV